MINISVIIPVYKAEPYIREAVESALAQPETAEVILVEDGSPDGSLAVCQEIARQYDRVRLLRHPNGDNRGAGASRNLGIAHATSEYIAFLDADDYYLPGRFEVAARLLAEHPDVDGVYETIGMDYVTPAARDDLWLRAPEMAQRGLLGPYKAVPPEKLLAALFENHEMYFSGDGLTVRRSALLRAGGYPTNRFHQDVLLCYRLAFHARLVAGSLDRPVARYRLDGNNRSSVLGVPRDDYFRRQRDTAETLWEWSINKVPPELEQRPFRDFMRWTDKLLVTTNRWVRKFVLLRVLGGKLIRHPVLLTRAYFRNRLLREYVPFIRAYLD